MESSFDDLARNISELSKEPIGDKPMEFAKTSLLDWLGAAIIGSKHSGPVLREIGVQFVRDITHETGATIIGNGRLSDPVTAALHNGVAGHILDFDDVLITRHQPIHPTAPIAPAVLATAELLSARGEDMLRALVLGIETVFRLSQSINDAHFRRGWHVTATLGTVGASVAAGLLLGLSRQQLRHAIWLSTTQMAGLRTALGTFAKPLQVGKAASTGLTCALLSRTNAQLEPCLDQGDWLHSAYSLRKESVTPAQAPRRFAIESTLYKRYPSCGEAHDAINAILHMEKPPPWQSLRRIKILAPETSVLLAGVLKPTNSLAAKFSIPYCTCVALVHRAVGVSDFAEEAMIDPRIAGLLERTELIPHSAKGTRVELEFEDGTTLSVKPDVARNIKDIAAGCSFVRKKFADNTEPQIGQSLSRQLMELVLRLDRAATVRELSEALRKIAVLPAPA